MLKLTEPMYVCIPFKSANSTNGVKVSENILRNVSDTRLNFTADNATGVINLVNNGSVSSFIGSIDVHISLDHRTFQIFLHVHI